MQLFSVNGPCSSSSSSPPNPPHQNQLSTHSLPNHNTPILNPTISDVMTKLTTLTTDLTKNQINLLIMMNSQYQQTEFYLNRNHTMTYDVFKHNKTTRTTVNRIHNYLRRQYQDDCFEPVGTLMTPQFRRLNQRQKRIFFTTGAQSVLLNEQSTCASPTCTKSIIDTPNNVNRYFCARCISQEYCSRECFMAHSREPHNGPCEIHSLWSHIYLYISNFCLIIYIYIYIHLYFPFKDHLAPPSSSSSQSWSQQRL